MLKPLEIIISKKNLFILEANFFEMQEFTATTPPNALIGSQSKAFWKELICSFSIDTPHGLACLIMTVPSFLFKFFKIDKAV